MRQSVEPIVDHPQSITEVLLAILPSGQISKVGRDTRGV